MSTPRARPAAPLDRRVRDRAPRRPDPNGAEAAKDAVRRSRARIALGALWAATLLLAAFAWVTEANGFKERRLALAGQAQADAKMMATHDRYEIEMADQLIRSLMSHMDDALFNGTAGPERDAAFEKVLQEHRARLPGIFSFSVAGADGIRRHGVTGPNLTNLSGRPYFKAFKAGADFYAGSAEEGVMQSRFGIQVARAWRAPGGELRGLAVINLSIAEAFLPYYRSFALSTGAKLDLRTSRTLLLEYPAPASGAPDQSQAMSREVGALIAAGANSALGPLEQDGQTWSAALERLPDTSIYAQASLPESAALAGQRREAAMAALAVLGAALAALVATKATWRSLDDQTKLAVAYEDMRTMAMRDKLTGLPNRAHMIDAFDAWRDKIVKEGGSAALVFCDMDRFKAINDTHGHHIGDAFLREAAKRLQRSAEPHGWACRLGGDEFVLAIDLGGEGNARAVRACERALEEFAKPFALSPTLSINGGVSLGAACLPNDGSDWQEISRKADVAMYQAKRGGRGRFAIFQASMEAQGVPGVDPFPSSHDPAQPTPASH